MRTKHLTTTTTKKIFYQCKCKGHLPFFLHPCTYLPTIAIKLTHTFLQGQACAPPLHIMYTSFLWQPKKKSYNMNPRAFPLNSPMWKPKEAWKIILEDQTWCHQAHYHLGLEPRSFNMFTLMNSTSFDVYLWEGRKWRKTDRREPST